MKKVSAFYFLAILAALLVSGCVPRYVGIMAPESMFEENRMQRLALLGEGGVVWVWFTFKPDIEESRKGLETVLSAVEEALEAKGYVVAFSRPVRIVFGVGEEQIEARKKLQNWHVVYGPLYSRPVGISHRALGRDGRYTVYENYLKEKENKRELPLGEPAYEYSFEGEEGGLREAATGVLDKTGCLAGWEKRPGTCQGLKDDLFAIHNATGADTLCLVEVTGINRTFGSKVISLIAEIFGGGGGGITDTTGISFTCVDAKTGELLWQHMLGYPLAASSTVGRDDIGRAFRYFPDAGRPLEAD